MELETDAHRLDQRRKQVSYGLATAGYANYNAWLKAYGPQTVKVIPTPNIYMKMSKRNWDTLMREWRRELHKWDPVIPTFLTPAKIEYAAFPSSEHSIKTRGRLLFSSSTSAQSSSSKTDASPDAASPGYMQSSPEAAGHSPRKPSSPPSQPDFSNLSPPHTLPHPAPVMSWPAGAAMGGFPMPPPPPPPFYSHEIVPFPMMGFVPAPPAFMQPMPLPTAHPSIVYPPVCPPPNPTPLITHPLPVQGMPVPPSLPSGSGPQQLHPMHPLYEPPEQCASVSTAPTITTRPASATPNPARQPIVVSCTAQPPVVVRSQRTDSTSPSGFRAGSRFSSNFHSPSPSGSAQLRSVSPHLTAALQAKLSLIQDQEVFEHAFLIPHSPMDFERKCKINCVKECARGMLYNDEGRERNQLVQAQYTSILQTAVNLQDERDMLKAWVAMLAQDRTESQLQSTSRSVADATLNESEPIARNRLPCVSSFVFRLVLRPTTIINDVHQIRRFSTALGTSDDELEGFLPPSLTTVDTPPVTRQSCASPPASSSGCQLSSIVTPQPMLSVRTQTQAFASISDLNQSIGGVSPKRFFQSPSHDSGLLFGTWLDDVDRESPRVSLHPPPPPTPSTSPEAYPCTPIPNDASAASHCTPQPPIRSPLSSTSDLPLLGMAESPLLLWGTPRLFCAPEAAQEQKPSTEGKEPTRPAPAVSAPSCSATGEDDLAASLERALRQFQDLDKVDH